MSFLKEHLEHLVKLLKRLLRVLEQWTRGTPLPRGPRVMHGYVGSNSEIDALWRQNDPKRAPNHPFYPPCVVSEHLTIFENFRFFQDVSPPEPSFCPPDPPEDRVGIDVPSRLSRRKTRENNI